MRINRTTRRPEAVAAKFMRDGDEMGKENLDDTSQSLGKGPPWKNQKRRMETQKRTWQAALLRNSEGFGQMSDDSRRRVLSSYFHENGRKMG